MKKKFDTYQEFSESLAGSTPEQDIQPLLYQKTGRELEKDYTEQRSNKCHLDPPATTWDICGASTGL